MSQTFKYSNPPYDYVYPMEEFDIFPASVQTAIRAAAPESLYTQGCVRAKLQLDRINQVGAGRNPVWMEPVVAPLFENKKSDRMSAIDACPMRPRGPGDMIEHILATLPSRLRVAIESVLSSSGTETATLCEIRLDVGMPPRVAISSSDHIVHNYVLEPPDDGADGIEWNTCMDDIMTVIQSPDVIIADETKNRMYIRGTMHRVSVLLEKVYEGGHLSDRCRALTIRVGRNVPAAARILSDVILNEEAGSVLLIGPPGSGKTTVMRSMIQIAAGNTASGCSKKENVFVVDTSRELACEDVDMRLSTLGFARAVYATKAGQHDAMSEVLLNHFPTIMAIDEIESGDVDILRRITASGVRVFATAHASSLLDAVHSSTLSPLLGGVQSVTRGDAQCISNGGSKKIVQERAGEPHFKTVVQITDHGFFVWYGRENLSAGIDAALMKDEADTRSEYGAAQQRLWPPLSWPETDPVTCAHLLVGMAPLSTIGN